MLVIRSNVRAACQFSFSSHHHQPRVSYPLSSSRPQGCHLCLTIYSSYSLLNRGTKSRAADPIHPSSPQTVAAPYFHIPLPFLHHLTKNLLTQFIILHHFPKKIKGLLLPTLSIAHQHKEILLLVKSRGLISSWVHVCL
ncbi:hypothetical protein RchiOBHm_Chr1g0363691 [Rosa chinensis]|uniref:Uncharacterized protein n=1 Tax=Rosa chinensis TaxID=74649 RepID=A0A2P6SJI1_ROSCH|nr:hypothetical protein RchiOBHm_Chr1g0363691 [Rosa chinensis]